MHVIDLLYPKTNPTIKFSASGRTPDTGSVKPGTKRLLPGGDGSPLPEVKNILTTGINFKLSKKTNYLKVQYLVGR